MVGFGNGDGTFGSFVSYAENSNAQGVVAADFNGDGFDDLAIADSSGSTDNVTVRLGSQSGALSISDTFGSEVFDLAFGDINGDGILDLVATDRGGSFSFIGTGEGSFSEYSSASNAGSSIALADFNGDGISDIVGANYFSTEIFVSLGNSREGIQPIGEFSLETRLDALRAIPQLERKAQSLSEQRGIIGAFQSRLQTALNTLSSTSENYAAAESRIRDADIAFESSQLTRLNILQQASATVLGQANLQPSLALTLLQ